MAAKIDPLRASEIKDKFVEHLKTTCNITRTCEELGLNRGEIYQWRLEDEDFAMRWEAALEIGFEAMEDEMRRRAYIGTVKMTKDGSTYREYSDVLAIFLAKAHKPDKYSDRVRNEISGPGGQPLNLSDDKIALKLDVILKSALDRKNKALAEADDFDDLC